MTTAQPLELVVYDAVEPCPYLPGYRARMPLRWPSSRLSATQFDRQLAEGDRRHGVYLYRTRCPACQACEPIRVPVADFVPSRSQLRVQQRGDRLLDMRLGPVRADARRVQLLNRHRQLRGLCGPFDHLDQTAYREFLVHSCCETLEMGYYLEDQLVAVAVVDRGEQSLSAVYTFFEPDLGRLSLGIYSILKQIDLCRQWGYRYLYLGLYIAQSRRMSYKALFRPHERLIGGDWRRFA